LQVKSNQTKDQKCDAVGKTMAKYLFVPEITQKSSGIIQHGKNAQ
jgi:hypothetical protein